MNKKLIIIIACLILTSCSASWHIRKAQKKDPSLFITEVVKVIDTVIVEVPRIDTLFKYEFDTVEIMIDSIQVKYFYQTKDSTVYLEIDCPDNEIITNTVTKTKTIIVKPTFKEKLISGLWILIVITGIYFLFRLIRKTYHV